MDEDELSAPEDGIQIKGVKPLNKSPPKPVKRGRGRPKKAPQPKVEASDNDDTLNGSQQVASLKHVGKFRYLSKLTRTDEDAEVDPAAKPVIAGRGRGRGRGRPRGRGASRHLTANTTSSASSSLSQQGEESSSSHVSRSGRRIKPNSRWTTDSEFDSSPTKVPSGRGGRRRTTTRGRGNKAIFNDDSSTGGQSGDQSTVAEEDIDESRTDPSGSSTINDGHHHDTPSSPKVNGVDVKDVAECPTPSPSALPSETLQSDHPLECTVNEVECVEEVVTNNIEASESVEECLVTPSLVIESEHDVEDSGSSSASGPTSAAPSEMTVTDSHLPCRVDDDIKAVEVTKLDTPPPPLPVEVVEPSTTVSEADDSADTEPVTVVLRRSNRRTTNHVLAAAAAVEVSESVESEKEDSSQGFVESTSSSLKDPAIEHLSSYNSSSAGNTPIDDEAFADVQPSALLISPKPVKVKSRWRRTSELEQVVGRNGTSDAGSCNNSPLTMSPRSTGYSSLPLRPDNRIVDHSKELGNHKSDFSQDDAAIIEERLKSFEIMDENLYLTTVKTSKEVKRMLCDCTLSKEEIARGELGCGDDCINRLLMIECGSRCQLGNRCTNKRFQKRQYAKIEIFNTEKKGVGLRALQDLEAGDFIIEYIGEVIDPREFHRRAKEYARDKNKHYYFMALKSDAIIDATNQGNISRFINHSCDPNAETQKWTVNGDLRVGFFVRKSCRAGEELTFDYQFQRYGKEAQRCYCESYNCRGWIGEDPEKEDKNKEKREKRDREKRRKSNLYRDEVNNVDLEREIDRLASSGVKNRAQTLTLSRLMVRAEDFETRKSILSVLRNAEQACRRLFLDYHGLKLLWGWMVDAASAGNQPENIQFKINLLTTLASLPVPNKTMLLDSKLMSIVEKWTAIPSDSTSVPPPPLVVKKEDVADSTDQEIEVPAETVVVKSEDGNEDSSTPSKTQDESTQETVKQENAPDSTVLHPSCDVIKTEVDETLANSCTVSTSNDAPEAVESQGEPVAELVAVVADKGEVSESVVLDENLLEKAKQVVTMASQLLESWSNLKEVFRIPKKERIEKMKEHEREADELSLWTTPAVEEMTVQTPSTRPVQQSSYDRRPNNIHRLDFSNRDFKDKDKFKRQRESPDRENRKIPRLDMIDNLTKEERRRLFALRVAAQDEALRLKRLNQEALVGGDIWRRHLEHCLALGFDPSATPVNFEATPFITGASPGLGLVLPQVVWDPNLNSWQPCPEVVPEPTDVLPPPQSSALTPLSESSSIAVPKIPLEPPVLHLVVPKGYNPTFMGPLIMEFDFCEYEASGIPYVPASLVAPLPAIEEPVDSAEPIDPSADDNKSKLPRFWRQSIDDQGRTYYFHVRLRLPQWEPPLPDDETPDFSSEEEEEEKEEAPTAVEEHPESSVSAKEQERIRRRNLLCHERIINPRSEFERSEDAQRYRELKERVLRLKLVRIRERGLWIEEQPKHRPPPKLKSNSRDREKRKQAEKEKLRKRAKEKQKRALLKVETSRKKHRGKEKVDSTLAVTESVTEEAQVNGDAKAAEFNPEEDAVGKDLMDGSMDDEMLMNLADGEDEAGEKERNRNVSASTARKIKDGFRMKISSDIVNILNPFRRPDCKFGRITCNDDFKHLARKMTHFVLAKELKHCRNIEELVVNDSVKHKAKDFIKKYMTKFGPVYKRGNDDDI